MQRAGGAWRRRPLAGLADVLCGSTRLGRVRTDVSSSYAFLTAEMSSASFTLSDTSTLPLPSAWLKVMP